MPIDLAMRIIVSENKMHTFHTFPSLPGVKVSGFPNKMNVMPVM
jgi:hypothetical protein